MCEDRLAHLFSYLRLSRLYNDLWRSTRGTPGYSSCKAYIGQVPYRRAPSHVTLCRHRHQQAIEVQQGGLHPSQPTPAGSTAKRIIRAVPVSDTSPPALVLHKTSTWHAVYARLIRRLQACLLTQPVGGISTARYATRPWPPSSSTPGPAPVGLCSRGQTLERPSNSYWNSGRNSTATWEPRRKLLRSGKRADCLPHRLASSRLPCIRRQRLVLR